MKPRPYAEVDVFASAALSGNALAVVFDADDLSDAQMQAFARWTNFSETTFVLRPDAPGADYRVRIFTPGGELPFAGHPTLGTCHAWLQRGGVPQGGSGIVQQCAKGLVRLQRSGEQLAFEAPAMQASALDTATLHALCAALQLPVAAVQAHALLDNGPQWAVLQLADAQAVLHLRPDFAALAALPKLGVVGAWPSGSECAFELRGFAPSVGVNEDPVTGSLNASVAQWLMSRGAAPAQYVAAQGQCVGRAGRVHVQRDAAGRVWVGGHVHTRVLGELQL